MRKRAYNLLFGLLVLTQMFVCFQGLADEWTRGHNGFNGSAYHQAARNTLRFGSVFPRQYYTGRTPTGPTDVYTHHPLAMHWHNTAAIWAFGDSNASLRLVPAIHGVLALVMLILVMSRLYGPGVALLTGWTYVLLPINGIYANMANHSNGFIFYGLLTFWCYFRFAEAFAKPQGGRWKRWFLGMLAAYFMCALWDWPANYLAFGIALHWLISGYQRHLRAGGRWYRPNLHLWLLVVWSVWVLAQLIGHFTWVVIVQGSFDELAQTFQKRQSAGVNMMRHYRIVPELMHTWPVLLLAAGWLASRIRQTFKGQLEIRDVMPLTWGCGGITHYVLFSWSAFVHSYWGWTALPFVAMTVGISVHWLARKVQGPPVAPPPGWRSLTRWRPILAGLLVFALLTPLAYRSAWLVPQGRSVGGSLWFITHVRAAKPEKYTSGRPGLRFMRFVKEHTDRNTGVLLHRGLDRDRPERRFTITLDREHKWLKRGSLGLAPPKRIGVTGGWVLAAPVKSIRARERRFLAAKHPWLQYGDFVMVDLRRNERDIRIWNLPEAEMSLGWWFWHSPWEAPITMERDDEAEAALRAEIDKAATRNRRRPGKRS